MSRWGPHRRMFRIFDEELTMVSEQQRAALVLSHRGHLDEWVGALQHVSRNAHPRVLR